MAKPGPQDVYLQKVQTDYKAYCYHVHNHGLANPAWIPSRFHVFLCDVLQEFVERETDKAFEILVLNTPPQHGKLCADSTPVLTAYGWKKHGDSAVGDKVYNHRG